MKSHQKHPKLTRTQMGNFARNEIAILGTTCSEIAKIANEIANFLKDSKVGYMDADHGSREADYILPSLINKISHWQYNEAINKHGKPSYEWTQNMGMLLINGNHEQGQYQIVIVDKEKRESLKKRIDQLTNVLMVLDIDGEGIPDFLVNKISASTPIISLKNKEKWLEFVKRWLADKTPPIYGLLLNGGKSQRMGRPKSELVVEGKTMLDRGYELLSSVCEVTFVSVVEKDPKIEYPCIEDRMKDFGPYGGILSAFMHNPNVAWMVMAIDLPKVDIAVLTELIEGRDLNKVATAFHNETTGFPDPLITLWEPRSYARLLHFISLGHSCPRKVLINSNVNVIKSINPNCLFNMNTMEDYLNQ